VRNTEIIYMAAGKPRIETVKVGGYCKVCGTGITEGIKENEVISGSFTNWSELKYPESQHVCAACTWCIKNAELRTSNFVSDANNLYMLKKNDLEGYLFNLEKHVSGEFVVGITTSFKKHNSFRCKVNSNPKRFWIRQEDAEYIFDVDKLRPLYNLLNEAYLQFSKDEMLTGHYKMISVEQYSLDKFRQLENTLRPHRGAAQFELLIFMLNSEKRQEYMQAKIAEQKKAKGEKTVCRKEEVQEQQLSLL
jgi:hypothetical protein